MLWLMKDRNVYMDSLGLRIVREEAMHRCDWRPKIVVECDSQTHEIVHYKPYTTNELVP